MPYANAGGNARGTNGVTGQRSDGCEQLNPHATWYERYCRQGEWKEASGAKEKNGGSPTVYDTL